MTALAEFDAECQSRSPGRAKVQAWVSFSCSSPSTVCSGESFARCVAAVDASPQVRLPACLAEILFRSYKGLLLLLPQSHSSHACPPRAALPACRQVMAVGINCSSPQYVEALIRLARTVLPCPPLPPRQYVLVCLLCALPVCMCAYLCACVLEGGGNI